MLAGPIVGIVLNERLLILAHTITLHNPLDGRFAVDDILVGFLWNVLEDRLCDEGTGLQAVPF